MFDNPDETATTEKKVLLTYPAQNVKDYVPEQCSDVSLLANT